MTSSSAPETHQGRAQRRSVTHDARATAVQILELILPDRFLKGDVTTSQAFPHVQQALDQALGAWALGDRPAQSANTRRDAALCTEIVYGSLRRHRLLQTILHAHLRAPEKLPSLVRTILLTSCYSLFFLTRVPAYASVNWATSQTRSQFGAGLARVVNGVLRTIERQKADFLGDAWLSAYCLDPQERLSLRTSIPLWVLELWTSAYGQEYTNTLAMASSLTPWSCVRVNRQHPDWAAYKDTLLRSGGEAFGHAGVRFAPGSAPDLREALLAGRVSRQGSGAQEILEALDVESWEGPIWDACAGYGGKTAYLLEAGKQVTLASDPHSGRLQGMLENLQRLKLPAPEVKIAPAQNVFADTGQDAAAPMFKTIVLDVPCSGLGTFARRPDVAFRPQELITNLCQTQREIIDASWPYLAQGGQMVYLTCTLNPAENEDQVERLLNTWSNAQLVKTFQLAPDHYGADMLYGALLRKK